VLDPRDGSATTQDSGGPQAHTQSPRGRGDCRRCLLRAVACPDRRMLAPGAACRRSSSARRRRHGRRQPAAAACAGTCAARRALTAAVLGQTAVRSRGPRLCGSAPAAGSLGSRTPARIRRPAHVSLPSPLRARPIGCACSTACGWSHPGACARTMLPVGARCARGAVWLFRAATLACCARRPIDGICSPPAVTSIPQRRPAEPM